MTNVTTETPPADVPTPLPDAPLSFRRRSVLTGLVAGVGGLAVGGAAGRRSVRREPSTVASPAQQEMRGDAGFGGFGIWPIIWSVPVSSASNAVALTFDDGPDPEFTPHVLEALRAHGAKATFMMMGWNCVHHPDLVKQVVADGHEIGNHTWSHLDLAQVDPVIAESELRRGRDAIEKISGRDLGFFRPPRGELSGVAARYAAEAEQSILMWTINGGAHKERTSSQVRDHVVSSLKPGYIVDFHDGIGRGTFDRKAQFALDLIAERTMEVAALPSILDTLTARGVKFVTISELLAEPRVPSGQ